jgi:dTDP-4-dehydrorhamnose 3,5-epimerase-like enzyme
MLGSASTPAMVHEAARGTACVEPLRGASLFQIKTHADSRGELTAFDRSSNLGFQLQRVFFIRVERANTIRAEHACSAEQVIIALTGGVTVDISNGYEQRTVRLIQGGRALWLSAGIWLRLREFSNGTVLSVAASVIYEDTVYFDRPQPDLISAD